MALEGSQRLIFEAYIIHCHGPTGFAVGEAKEVPTLQMLGDHGEEVPFSLSIYLSIFVFVFFAKHFHSYEERKEEEMVKHEGNSQNYLMWKYL